MMEKREQNSGRSSHGLTLACWGLAVPLGSGGGRESVATETKNAGVATGRKEAAAAAASGTYHGPHAVRGGGAERVVVRVGCCIDSAVAAGETERSVNIHARSANAGASSRLFQPAID